jgi:hypothetical protein
MIHDHAAFSEQFLDIAVGQAVTQIPAHRDRDHLTRELIARRRRRRSKPRVDHCLSVPAAAGCSQRNTAPPAHHGEPGRCVRAGTTGGACPNRNDRPRHEPERATAAATSSPGVEAPRHLKVSGALSSRALRCSPLSGPSSWPLSHRSRGDPLAGGWCRSRRRVRRGATVASTACVRAASASTTGVSGQRFQAQ